MTYGQIAADMREAMVEILPRHRVSFHVGRTQEERCAGAATILRCRAALLTYATGVVGAWGPTQVTYGVRAREMGRTAQALHRHLVATHDPAVPAMPISEALSRDHHSGYVEAWQRAARATVLAEREPAVLGVGLTAPQHRQVVLDACDVLRALVLVDRHFGAVPDWHPMNHRAWIGQFADHLARQLRIAEADTSVDEVGHRDTGGMIIGPAMPGFAGVLQAQHNMALQLQSFPNASNLRRVMKSQAVLSLELARLTAPGAADASRGFRERAQVYGDLLRDARALGGLVGDGGLAAFESSNAACRAEHVGHLTDRDLEAVGYLRRQSQVVDLRIAGAIERGCDERLYFTRVTLPRLDEVPRAGIHPQSARWLPVDGINTVAVRERAATQLCPGAFLTPPPLTSTEAHGRDHLQAGIAREADCIGRPR